MHGLKKETRRLRVDQSISLDIAKHLSTVGVGCIVIIVNHPNSMLASIRKQCERVIRNSENRKASTNNPKQILECTNMIAMLRSREFIAADPLEAAEKLKDVILATPMQVLDMPPVARVMYVATPLETEALHKVTSWMPEGGQVIIYEV
jgi:GTP-sensing pleiotropic transcriptional regulator CodY